MMVEMSACNVVYSSHHPDLLPFEKKTPGNPDTNDYALHFRVDYKVVEQGATYTYRYGGGSETHDLGGGRSGYGAFGELVLDFTFKDGRVFHEVINLRKLMADMLQKYDIYDLKKTKFGGTAELNIRIDEKRVSIDYTITHRVAKNPFYILKYYQYPIFEKILTHHKQSGFKIKTKENDIKFLPGNPDLNLFGISFVLNRDVFSQGNYKYDFEKDKITKITENGRYGYQNANELKLNFTLKDGRNIEKNIDLIPLFADLQKNANIIDLSKSKFGGYADLVIRIERDHLAIDYRLLERKKKTKLSEIEQSQAIYLKNYDRSASNYRLIRELTKDSTQYTEYLYPIYWYNFKDK